MKPKIYISIPSNSNVWKEYSKTFIDMLMSHYTEFDIGTCWIKKEDVQNEIEETDILIMLSASPRSCLDLGYFCGICCEEIRVNGFTNKLVLGLDDGIAVNPEIIDCINHYGVYCYNYGAIIAQLDKFLAAYIKGVKAKRCLECDSDAKCREAELKGQVTSCPCLECLNNCEGCELGE